MTPFIITRRLPSWNNQDPGIHARKGCPFYLPALIVRTLPEPWDAYANMHFSVQRAHLSMASIPQDIRHGIRKRRGEAGPVHYWDKSNCPKKKVVTALLVSSTADRLGPQAQTRRVRPKPFTLAPVVFWDSATCAAGFRADHCAIFPATTTQNKKQCAWKKGSTGQCWAILGNKRHLGHDRPWRKAWETVCFLEEIS